LPGDDGADDDRQRIGGKRLDHGLGRQRDAQGEHGEEVAGGKRGSGQQLQVEAIAEKYEQQQDQHRRGAEEAKMPARAMRDGEEIAGHCQQHPGQHQCVVLAGAAHAGEKHHDDHRYAGKGKSCFQQQIHLLRRLEHQIEDAECSLEKHEYGDGDDRIAAIVMQEIGSVTRFCSAVGKR